jgi:hypothetical protein
MSTTAAPKKGNKTTEIIIGSAASRMEAAVKSLLQVAPEVEKLQTTIANGTLEVVNLEDKIGALKQDYTNKVAQNKIELEQAYKADAKGYVDEYLAKNNLTAIETDELDEMKNDLEEATTKMEANISKAVVAATSSLKKDHDNADALAKMTFEKKEAENTAKITQLEGQVKFLTEQVGYWKKALEDERTAGVERAKASSIGTLNVGQQGR